MKKKDVIEYFGNTTKTASALELTYQAVKAWDEVLPVQRQCHIECFTNGRLKADIKREGDAGA